MDKIYFYFLKATKKKAKPTKLSSFLQKKEI